MCYFQLKKPCFSKADVVVAGCSSLVQECRATSYHSVTSSKIARECSVPTTYLSLMKHLAAEGSLGRRRSTRLC